MHVPDPALQGAGICFGVYGNDDSDMSPSIIISLSHNNQKYYLSGSSSGLQYRRVLPSTTKPGTLQTSMLKFYVVITSRVYNKIRLLKTRPELGTRIDFFTARLYTHLTAHLPHASRYIVDIPEYIQTAQTA